VDFVMRRNVREGIEICRKAYPKDANHLISLHHLCIKRYNNLEEAAHISGLFMELVKKDSVEYQENTELDPELCAFLNSADGPGKSSFETHRQHIKRLSMVSPDAKQLEKTIFEMYDCITEKIPSIKGSKDSSSLIRRFLRLSNRAHTNRGTS